MAEHPFSEALLEAGQRLLGGKYVLQARLGQGAFAQVWLATHTQLNAPRALKALHRDAPGVGSTAFHDHRLRFRLEAQLGARIEHPHVVRVYDLEEMEDLLVLVMEYAPGGSLQARLDEARAKHQPLPIEACLRIAREVAEGLAAVHALDAVHRDLKPSNILFDAEGRAKVADLGLAQVPGGPSLRSVVSQGVPHPGTPGYMSPEQERTYGHLAPASDVYALGLILFEMLTGRMYRMVRPGTRARALREEMPEWLDELVGKMLAKELEERPWDGAEVTRLIREEEARARREQEEKARREAEERARRKRRKPGARKPKGTSNPAKRPPHPATSSGPSPTAAGPSNWTPPAPTFTTRVLCPTAPGATRPAPMPTWPGPAGWATRSSSHAPFLSFLFGIFPGRRTVSPLRAGAAGHPGPAGTGAALLAGPRPRQPGRPPEPGPGGGLPGPRRPLGLPAPLGRARPARRGDHAPGLGGRP